MKFLWPVLAICFGTGAAFLSPVSTSSSFRTIVESKMAGTEEGLATNDISRRSLFGSVAASALWIQAMPDGWAAEGPLKLSTFEDTDYGFKMSVPANWEKSEQTLPDRRKIVIFMDPTSDKKTLLFLAYTPVRDDFTQLSSFGSVDQVVCSCYVVRSYSSFLKSSLTVFSRVSLLCKRDKRPFFRREN